MGNGKGLGGLIALIGLAYLFSKPRRAVGAVGPVGWPTQVIEAKLAVVAEEVESLGLEEVLPLNGKGVVLPHQVLIAKRRIIMPTFPTYPQVTPAVIPAVTPARPRIDPKIEHYEEALAEKYPEELEATREAYKATRKILGLKERVIPPMPKVTAPTRRVRR